MPGGNPRTQIRVLFYEPYPMGLGGNFLTQRLLLERLDRRQFHPVVMAPLEGVALEWFRRLGVECVVIPPPGSLGRYGGAVLRAGILGRIKVVFDLVRYNLQVAKFLRMRGIDVIYSNCVRAQLSVGLASLLARVPALLYIKGELANPIVDLLCFTLATRIAFQSESNATAKYPSMIRIFRSKIVIIRPGVDSQEISRSEARNRNELRRELEIEDAYVNTLVLGQLSDLKGVDLVIEALSKIVHKCPPVRLYIVGDCVIEDHRAYREKLFEMVSRLGLKKYVRFTGWRSDALEIIGCMSVVIQPSLSEGFSGVVLESMALGRPLVATAVGGHGEIIKDGVNGFLVKPGDVDGIAKRWRQLLMSADLRARLGAEARNTVFSGYLVDQNVERFAEICVQMVQGNR